MMKRVALAALVLSGLCLAALQVSPASALPERSSVAERGTASISDDSRFSARKNIRIASEDSAFGRMLFNRAGQAIYIFEKETTKQSRCYGTCAREWPPVLTKGKPKAVRGVRQGLLGTTKRRGGATQVTYNGKPLYYYRDELPGQVFCHNVFLNGGLWLVIGPNGKSPD
jgi:predicted lipoprotein with Yx(FWY)xxD motif